MSRKKNWKRGCWNRNWDVSKVRKKKQEWGKDAKKENGKKIETGGVSYQNKKILKRRRKEVLKKVRGKNRVKR